MNGLSLKGGCLPLGDGQMFHAGLNATVALAGLPPHSLDLDLLSFNTQSGEPDLSLSVGLARRFADFLSSGFASPMTCSALALAMPPFVCGRQPSVVIGSLHE